VTFNGVTAKLRHLSAFYSCLAEVVNEIGTLVDSNAGTLGVTIGGPALGAARRTWP
jgi:hypothetical protein